MIPEQILNPKGCGKDIFYEPFTKPSECGKGHGVNLRYCKTCKSIQKAQAQVLLDEKIREIKILSKIDNIWSKQEDSTLHSILLDRIHTIVCNKYDELQEEIKVLEEMLK